MSDDEVKVRVISAALTAFTAPERTDRESMRANTGANWHLRFEIVDPSSADNGRQFALFLPNELDKVKRFTDAYPSGTIVSIPRSMIEFDEDN